MNSELHSHYPTLRCYRCGSPQVSFLCHHCGRPMCSAHGPNYPAIRWFTTNREFDKLPLQDWPIRSRKAVHCHEHVHSSPSYERLMLMPGLLLLLVGLVLAVLTGKDAVDCVQRLPAAISDLSPAVAAVLREPGTNNLPLATACYRPEIVNLAWRLVQALSLLAYGVVIAIVGARLNNERVTADLAGWRPPIPISPFTRGIRATETVRGEIRLDRNGEYQEQIRSIQGEIDPGLEFTKNDQACVNAYQEKYGLKDILPEKFSAGYIALLGRPALQSESSSDIDLLMPLEGIVGDYLFLTKPGDRPTQRWHKRWTYQVAVGGDSTNASAPKLPVRIVPRLQESGNQRQLGLEVQLIGRVFGGDAELPAQVERLTLLTPSLLGHPKGDGELGRSSDSGISKYEWRYRNIPDPDLSKQDPSVETISRRTFVVSFDQGDITTARVEGTLIVRVPKLLSGLSWVRYVSGHGYPVEKPSFNSLEKLVTPATAKLVRRQKPAQSGLSRFFRRLRQALAGPNLPVPTQPQAEPAAAVQPPAADLPADKFNPNQFQVEDQGRRVSEARYLPPAPRLAVPAEYINDIEFQAWARFEISFTLELNTLVNHQIYNYSVPPISGKKPLDHRLIDQLIEKICWDEASKCSNPNYHVRHVIENNSQPDPRGRHQRRHLWDVAGRHYHLTFPIDFHIVLTGSSELVDGSDDSECKAEISTVGTAFDSETCMKIESTAHDLRRILQEILD